MTDQSTTEYFLEIHNNDGHYQGRLHQGDSGLSCELPELALGPQVSLTIKNKPCALGALVQALITFKSETLKTVFDERGQLMLGQYLYAQTLGRCPDKLQAVTGAEVLLRIISEDEHIIRLPWVLLARNGVFLATAGWSVMLGCVGDLSSALLPPSPSILVLMPQPNGTPATQAAAHLHDLETMLSAVDPYWSRQHADTHLHLAHTWQECRNQIAARHHDVLYYYGHGTGDAYCSRLVFAGDQSHERCDVAMADLANCLRQAPGGAPMLAYINCCRGDAGGVLGAGRQLLNIVPVVISNRTIAYIEAARMQAIAFWRAVLMEGLSPHQAAAGLYSQLGDMGLFFKDTRWVTPVLHGAYRDWHYHPPQPRNPLDRDPHWRVKLDRSTQISLVTHKARQMMRLGSPRALAYVWFGREGQGVDTFHRRIVLELKADNPGLHIDERNPNWPDHLKPPELSFDDMLADVL